MGINLVSGSQASNTGPSGTISLTTGAAPFGNFSATAGDINLTTGNGVTHGNINLNTSTADLYTHPGNIYMNSSNGGSVGIGVAPSSNRYQDTLSSRLVIQGTGNTSSSSSLNIINSSGTATFQVGDDGSVYIPTQLCLNGSCKSSWPGSTAYVAKTANYTAVAGDYLLADTSSGSFTITLPTTPAANTVIRIIDAKGTFNTNNLILAPNAADAIMGQTAGTTLNCDLNNAAFDIIYTGATYGWRIY